MNYGNLKLVEQQHYGDSLLNPFLSGFGHRRPGASRLPVRSSSAFSHDTGNGMDASCRWFV
jgi:hypothetical protein